MSHPYEIETRAFLDRAAKSGFTAVEVDTDPWAMPGEYVEPVKTIDEAVEHILSVDEANVRFERNGKYAITARFILGNDHGELVADFSWKNGDEENYEAFEKVNTDHYHKVDWAEFIPA
mgnify:CR=1 FL=1